MNEAMQKLIEAVQKASPAVWEAAYRQAHIDAVENFLALIAFAIGGSLLWIFAAHLADDNADEAGVFFARLGSVICFVVTLPFLFGFIDCALNPTFAAIKALKGLL